MRLVSWWSCSKPISTSFEFVTSFPNSTEDENIVHVSQIFVVLIYQNHVTDFSETWRIIRDTAGYIYLHKFYFPIINYPNLNLFLDLTLVLLTCESEE